MRFFYFEKLEVWRKSRILNKNIYLISQKFPVEEKFGITQQIRRACISIGCNLAEGSSRNTGKDQARFSEIAYGSLLEVMNLLIAAEDLLYLTEEEVLDQRHLIEEIGNKINALRQTQLKRT